MGVAIGARGASRAGSRWIGGRRLGWLAAALAGLVAFAVYLRTLAPEVTWADSGELILAAATFGVAHPPGSPLWVLLGHLASLLPVGSVAGRVNLLSAACAALAVAATAGLTLALLLPSGSKRRSRAAGGVGARSVRVKRSGSGRSQSGRALSAEAASPDTNAPPADAARVPVWAAPLAAGVAGLGFGFGATFWSFATIAEVYTLAIFLVAVGLAALLLWYAERDRASILGAPRPLVVVALSFGLALATHYSAAFTAPAVLALLVARRRDWRAWGARGFAVLAGAAAIGPALFLTLPLRAAASIPLAWGDPRTLDRFLGHVMAKQYQGNLFTSDLPFVVGQVRRALGVLASDLTPALLLLAALGIWTLARRPNRAPLWALLATLGFTLLVAVNYNIEEDWEAYLLVALLVLAALAGVGAHGLLTLAARRRWLAAGAGLVLAALPLVSLGLHFADQDHSRDWLARNYALNALAGLDQNGVLLTSDWNLYAPALYLQHVEGHRPDVTIVDLLLLRRSWYYRYLEERYPWLLAAARPEVDAFRQQLALFEGDRPYDSNTIQSRYVAMINAFIRAARRDRAVYLTPGWDAGVAADLSLVPTGMALQTFSRDEEAAGAGLAVALREPAWDLSGVTDGSAPIDAVGRRMLPTYSAAETNRGIYLASKGRWSDAEQAYRRALALNPSLAIAHGKLGLVLAAQGRDREALAAFDAALRLDPRNEEARRGRDASRQRLGG